MYVLGLNCSNRVVSQDALPGWSGHDGAAVILRDGQVLAAIEEERLDRIKHSNHFPVQAIKECLRIAGISLRDVDVVALNVERQSAGGPDPTNIRATVSALLQRHIGEAPRAQLSFVNHQLAHLFSAYGPSGFEECLCVSLDGLGDGASGAVGIGRGGDVEVLRELTPAQSLGDFYCEMIRPLGYSRFDEYKVMALAALGDSQACKEGLAPFYRLLEEGDFEIAAVSERRKRLRDLGLTAERIHTEPFSKRHLDYAAGLQAILADIVVHILGHFRSNTGLRRLALAGGVAHNCAVNGHILQSGMFDAMFVQPAAHDAGGALGAALASARRLGASPAPALRRMALGRALHSGPALAQALGKWEGLVEISAPADLMDRAAQELARGTIIGWAQGRSEFGPRALGYRSILGDPRRPEVRERINREIKRREPFRPFAPAVLHDEVWNFFERPPTDACLDHMTFLLRMKPELCAHFPAIVHEDGTARVQTVHRSQNMRLHQLIATFRDITSVPLVLNTSFNGHGEPIVDSIDDIVSCFLLTGLDLLVAGPFLVNRCPRALTATLLSRLSVSVPPSRKVVWRSIPGTAAPDERQFFIETTFARHLGGGAWPITFEVARLLMLADGYTPMHRLCVAHLPAAEKRSLYAEVLALWRSGHIRLLPRFHFSELPG